MSTSGTPPAAAPVRADVGVIGGSGFYEFLTGARPVRVDTPFGPPSDDIMVGDVGGRLVAFLARHGRDHRLPPHRINYRANLWALRSIGVRQVIAPCAVGSLRPEIGPGTVVVPDQVVDRTSGRAHTIYAAEGAVVHVAFAEPYCPRGRNAVLEAARSSPLPSVGEGTLVVVNGPRFSSRAESLWHQSCGWSVVGMTAMPEAAIARELALCFTTVAVVTDHDAGVDGGPVVTHEEVLRVFADSIDELRQVLRSAIAQLPATEPDAAAGCACRRALDGMALPFALPE